MTSDGSGYLRFPTICRDTIVFACEDDLWTVSAEGGRAWRLTAGVAEASWPRLSPDGSQLAFLGCDEGPAEVHLMPAQGGMARRLTYQAGEEVTVVGWRPDGGAIVYASDAGQPHRQDSRLFQIWPGAGLPEQLPVGHAHTISYGPDGGVVLGRHPTEPATWKRYRGGGAGDLWIDRDGSGEFTRLLNRRDPGADSDRPKKPQQAQLPGNLANPCWVGDRIYFLSDHEGVGNVYSCALDGGDLRRHSDHHDYYARNLSSDGRRLVYQCAGDLYLLEPSARDGDSAGAGPAGPLDVPDAPRRLAIQPGSSRTQRNRRYVPADEHLHSATLSPDGSSLAIASRGKAFSFGAWEGPVVQHGAADGVRYRLLTWLNDGERLLAAASDESEQERLTLLDADGAELAWDLDLGRVTELAVSPTADQAAVANHRNELWLINLPGPGDLTQPERTESAERTTPPEHTALPEHTAPPDNTLPEQPGGEPPPPTATARRVDHSPHGQVQDLAWSPDGRWLAYACRTGLLTSAIKLCRPAEHADSPDSPDDQIWQVTEPVLRDRCPAFDPDGKYLYFIGQREFTPVHDELQFDLGFPLGARPYAITLRAETPSPFTPSARPLDTDHPTTGRDGSAAPEARSRVEIDFEDIELRATPFPVPEGRYRRIAGVTGKALFSVHPVEGAHDTGHCVLEAYDFDKQESDRLVEELDDFWLSPDHKTVLYRLWDRLRVIKAGHKPDDSDQHNRASGWIDLSRVKVSVLPEAEWRQMFREAWRLQREHFWAQDMSGVDWDAAYQRYLPLVGRVSTRAELSDLLWEMQGELGTSHAYERGGEYRQGPDYAQGFLGVDWEHDRDTGRFRVGRVLRGDPGLDAAASPLRRPGVDVREGDVVLAINGQPVGLRADGATLVTPGELLVNQADQEVRLTTRRGDGAPRVCDVRTLADERPARHRDWVRANRDLVHERTQGRVGYLHVPDMMDKGFAEFHRGFLTELDREALIVDVRFNGGGNISGLLLQKLARRRIGYDFPRWGMPVPYLEESPRGPLVAIANEHSASDADLFSHGFKMLGLGTLVGKRTWGGVIGFEPRHTLADGALTTQPEFSFTFDDVGWRVENHGVDPDIDVDVAPQDYAAGADPQLERAIAVALEQLTLRPAHAPAPPARPRLAPPPLPPR